MDSCKANPVLENFGIRSDSPPPLLGQNPSFYHFLKAPLDAIENLAKANVPFLNKNVRYSLNFCFKLQFTIFKGLPTKKQNTMVFSDFEKTK